MQTGRDIRGFFRPATERVRTNGESTGEVSRTTLAPPQCILTTACRFPDSSAHSASCDTAKASALEQKPINTTTTAARTQPPSSALSRQSPPIPNSQSSITSAASKKTILNGKSVVLDSDSDSDLEDYELDWGLPSLDSKMPVETRAQATAARSPPTKSSIYLQQKRKPRWKTPVAPNRANAVVTRLIDQVKREDEAARQVAEYKAILEKPLETAPDAEGAIDQEDLANILDDDEEGGRRKRLLLAMKRTNATDSDRVFHFLKKPAKRPSKRSSSFPTRSISSSAMRNCFKGNWRNAMMPEFPVNMVQMHFPLNRRSCLALQSKFSKIRNCLKKFRDGSLTKACALSSLPLYIF